MRLWSTHASSPRMQAVYTHLHSALVCEEPPSTPMLSVLPPLNTLNPNRNRLSPPQDGITPQQFRAPLPPPTRDNWLPNYRGVDNASFHDTFAAAAAVDTTVPFVLIIISGWL